MLPLLLKSWGAPLGEPVAEDFDFLRPALFDRSWHLLDGGGSDAYWRPLSLQLYYRAFGRLMLAHPGAVAALHALALALGALLLYRALRTVWRGPLACAAAAFPLLAESTRQLIAWPDHSSDLLVFLFSALALHEASRRRLAVALLALLAALLCKELAVVTALLLPFFPPTGVPRRERVRWAAAVGGLVLVWGAAALAIRAHAHLVTPQTLVGGGAIADVSLLEKLVWALRDSLRAVFSLGPVHDRRDPVALVLAAAILLVTVGLALRRGAGTRLRRALPWIAWGAVWFAIASAALVPLYPSWLPNRSQFGSVGLGVALAGGLDAVGPLLPAVLVAARLLLLLIAPAPPREIVSRAPETGSWVDFERLTRLQLLMREMRRALGTQFPRLPRGAWVGLQYLPRQSSYAFGGSKALQAWYGDTTLRFVSFSDFMKRRDLPIVTMAEFQTDSRPQIALIAPGAMRASLEASDLIAAQRFADALAAVDRARAQQPEGGSVLFDGQLAGQRAVSLLNLGRAAEAGQQALLAKRLWPMSMPAHFVLALLALNRGQLDAAEAIADSGLRIDPHEPHLLEIRRDIDQARAVRGGTPPGAPSGR